MWDLRATAQPVWDYRGHTQDVTACKFLYPTSTQQGSSSPLVTCCKDGSLRVWDAMLPSSVHESSTVARERAALQTSKIYTSLTQLYNDEDTQQLPQDMTFCASCFDGSIECLSLTRDPDEQTADWSLQLLASTPPHVDPSQIEEE